MNVWVVITHYQLAREAEAMFSTETGARGHLDQREPGGLPEIYSLPVGEPIEDPGHLFAAHAYDGRYNVHKLVGIYGTYKAARYAAGENGTCPQLEVRFE